MKNNSVWGDYLSKMYGAAKIGEGKEVKIYTSYKDFEESFYRTEPIKDAKEPQIPNEELKKEVELAEQYLIGTDGINDEVITTDQENTKAEAIEVDAEPAAEEPSLEEIREFLKINNIELAESTNDKEENVTNEVLVNEHVIEEKPIETKVKSVKVSKPEVVKVEKEPKAKKETKKKEKTTKEVKPKAPRKPKK